MKRPAWTKAPIVIWLFWGSLYAFVWLEILNAGSRATSIVLALTGAGLLATRDTLQSFMINQVDRRFPAYKRFCYLVWGGAIKKVYRDFFPKSRALVIYKATMVCCSIWILVTLALVKWR
jgi:hypothetical protein